MRGTTTGTMDSSIFPAGARKWLYSTLLLRPFPGPRIDVEKHARITAFFDALLGNHLPIACATDGASSLFRRAFVRVADGRYLAASKAVIPLRHHHILPPILRSGC